MKHPPLIIMLLLVITLFALVGCDADHYSLAGPVHIVLSNRLYDAQGNDPALASYYILQASGPKGSTLGPLTIQSDSYTLHNLPIGQWQFNATSYNSDDQPLLCGSHSCSVGPSGSLIQLHLDQHVGSGTLEIECQWNGEQTYGDCTLKFTLFNQINAVVATQTKEVGSASESAFFSIEELDSGIYTLELLLSCLGEPLAGCSETVRIVANTPTVAPVQLLIGLIAQESSFIITEAAGFIIDGHITSDTTEYTAGQPALLCFELAQGQDVEVDELNYRWYCDGVLLAEESGKSLEIAAVLAGTRRYDVIVTDHISGGIGSASTLVSAWVEPSLVEH
ncbi:MAG: hypothetical protein ACOXZ4_07150 [Sphaerochaetaceae bacterium]